VIGVGLLEPDPESGESDADLLERDLRRKRLHQERPRTCLPGLRLALSASRGHEQDRQFRPSCAEHPGKGHARGTGHLDVGEYERVLVVSQLLHRGGRVRHGSAREAGRLEHAPEKLAQYAVIVDHKDVLRRGHLESAKVIVVAGLVLPAASVAVTV
jgi:hypothetical protein